MYTLLCDMFVAPGMGHIRKKPTTTSTTTKGQTNIVDRKSNRLLMCLANTLSAHRQDSQEKEIEESQRKYYDLRIQS